MSHIVSISIPPTIYADIMEKRKRDKETYSWSRIFKIGYMKATAVSLQEDQKKEELIKNVTALMKKLEYYAKRTLALEDELGKLKIQKKI